MKLPALIHFADAAPPASEDRPDCARTIGKPPRRLTSERYSAEGGALSMGDWACEVGAWRIKFHSRRHEFFQVLEGHVRLTDADGKVRDYRAGDACIIPAGFEGLFEVVEATRKRYVMLDRTEDE